jgi:hypothetical protein
MTATALTVSHLGGPATRLSWTAVNPARVKSTNGREAFGGSRIAADPENTISVAVPRPDTPVRMSPNALARATPYRAVESRSGRSVCHSAAAPLASRTADRQVITSPIPVSPGPGEERVTATVNATTPNSLSRAEGIPRVTLGP